MSTVICIMSSLKVKRHGIRERNPAKRGRVSLCSPAGLEPAIHTNKLPLNSEVCAHLCLQGPGIKGMCHEAQKKDCFWNAFIHLSLRIRRQWCELSTLCMPGRPSIIERYSKSLGFKKVNLIAFPNFSFNFVH